MLTVAHRLHTIMDYDVVLVMEQGRCIEFGPPKRLLEHPSGTFTALIDATGPESAAESYAILHSHQGPRSKT
jgi:ABC-type multidrug transport system fused ATPase/permease subunit